MDTLEKYELNLIGQMLTQICMRHSPEAASESFEVARADVRASIKRGEHTVSEWRWCLVECLRS